MSHKAYSRQYAPRSVNMLCEMFEKNTSISFTVDESYFLCFVGLRHNLAYIVSS